jgi:lysophospholipase L1-like esterase
MRNLCRLAIAVTAMVSFGLGCGSGDATSPGETNQGGGSQPPAGSGGVGAGTGGSSATVGVAASGGASSGGASAAGDGSGGITGITGGTGGTTAAGTGGGDASGTGGSVAGGGGVGQGGAGTGTGKGGAGPSPPPDMVPVDPSKKITVWMVGDSTMQNCAGSGQCGWASQFQQYLGPNATVSNQARGGRSIQTWIWGDPNISKSATDANGECQVIDNKTYSDNLTTMLDATRGIKPGDWVYVAFGINDGTKTCNRHVGNALFQSDLAFMATTIRSKGANPIFGTSTSGQSCSGSTNMPNRGFGPETKAAAAAANVPVIDLTQLSVDLYNSLQLCPAGSTTFWFDGTHFKTEGASKVAGVVAQAIKDQKIGLAAYLK